MLNKLIIQSIRETMEKENQVADDVVQEGADVQEDLQNAGEETISFPPYFESAVAAGISAGLGALALRNKVRMISEEDEGWERIAKVGTKFLRKADEFVGSDKDEDAAKSFSQRGMDPDGRTDNPANKMASKFELDKDKALRMGKKAAPYAAGAGLAGAGGVGGWLAARKAKANRK